MGVLPPCLEETYSPPIAMSGNLLAHVQTHLQSSPVPQPLRRHIQGFTTFDNTLPIKDIMTGEGCPQIWGLESPLFENPPHYILKKSAYC